jgi:hypothetical protein
MARQTKVPAAPAQQIDEEERRQMIAQAAYLRAEARAFQGGSAEEDWLAAEAEIDAQLHRAP